MTNLCFRYMYRDASNYKQHGDVIFSNEQQLPVNEIENQIRACLHDSEFFIAQKLHLEECFFAILDDDDHPWHEFISIEPTSTCAFDRGSDHTRDIGEFLAELASAQRVGWDEMNVRADLAKQLTEQT